MRCLHSVQARTILTLILRHLLLRSGFVLPPSKRTADFSAQKNKPPLRYYLSYHTTPCLSMPIFIYKGRGKFHNENGQWELVRQLYLYGGKPPINPGWYLPPWMAVSSPGYRHVVRRPWRNELERETGGTSVLPDPRAVITGVFMTKGAGS